MRDYSGSLKDFQKQLDEAKINYDVTLLCGCTYSEIRGVVNSLLEQKAKKMLAEAATSNEQTKNTSINILNEKRGVVNVNVI